MQEPASTVAMPGRDRSPGREEGSCMACESWVAESGKLGLKVSWRGCKNSIYRACSLWCVNDCHQERDARERGTAMMPADDVSGQRFTFSAAYEQNVYAMLTDHVDKVSRYNNLSLRRLFHARLLLVCIYTHSTFAVTTLTTPFAVFESCTLALHSARDRRREPSFTYETDFPTCTCRRSCSTQPIPTHTRSTAVARHDVWHLRVHQLPGREGQEVHPRHPRQWYVTAGSPCRLPMARLANVEPSQVSHVSSTVAMTPPV